MQLYLAIRNLWSNILFEIFCQVGNWWFRIESAMPADCHSCDLIFIPAIWLSFLRKQESSHFKSFRVPAFAGMTRFLIPSRLITFFEDFWMYILLKSDSGQFKLDRIYRPALARLDRSLQGFCNFSEPKFWNGHHVFSVWARDEYDKVNSFELFREFRNKSIYGVMEYCKY